MPSSNGHQPSRSLNELSDTSIRCRDVGHHFGPLDVVINKRAKEITRTMRCGACRTVKVQVLDLSGFVLRARYEYPEQLDPDTTEPYCLKGYGRLDSADRAQLRVWSSEAMQQETRGN